MDLGSIIKGAIIEYIKSHNEDSGKIIEFLNLINEINKCAQSLPIHTRNELLQAISLALAANGITIQLKR